jgi:hypothetical protein
LAAFWISLSCSTAGELPSVGEAAIDTKRTVLVDGRITVVGTFKTSKGVALRGDVEFCLLDENGGLAYKFKAPAQENVASAAFPETMRLAHIE